MRRTWPLALLAALLAACGGNEPQGEQTPAPGPSLSPSPVSARSVAYVDRNDLWLYDVASDRVTRLSTDGERTRESLPRFHGDSLITYVTDSGDGGNDSIMEVGLDGGSPREVVSAGRDVLALDWNPDGSALAYLTVDFERPEPHTLRLYETGDGRSVRVRAFPMHDGRGASLDDDVSIAWGPDGRSLLVTDTHLSPNVEQREETLFVLDRAGTDLIPPRLGTHGRWSPDGGAIYYRRFGPGDGGGPTPDPNEVAAWRQIEVASGRESALGLSPGTVSLAVSPDGQRLAAVTNDKELALVAYDLESRREQRFSAGLMGPVWLSPSTVAATRARPCRVAECEGPLLTGPAVRFELPERMGRDLALRSTGDADVLFAAPSG